MGMTVNMPTLKQAFNNNINQHHKEQIWDAMQEFWSKVIGESKTNIVIKN